MASPPSPLSTHSPAGPTHSLQPILLPSVGPCTAFAAMHQLNMPQWDGLAAPTGMALVNVSMGVFSPTQQESGYPTSTGVGVGILMTLALGHSGALTADCSGQQVMSCHATMVVVSESPLPCGCAPMRDPPNAFPTPGTPAISNVVGQMLSWHTADSSDASGVGQVVRSGDPGAYAMDPIDLEASAQMASGGPDVLLTAAAGLRAQSGQHAAAEQCSWLAGCARLLDPVEVSRCKAYFSDIL